MEGNQEKLSLLKWQFYYLQLNYPSLSRKDDKWFPFGVWVGVSFDKRRLVS